MPQAAAFIDALVAEFGQVSIHGQIRNGLNGQPTFWVRENGYEIGTRDTSSTMCISLTRLDAQGRPQVTDPDWMMEAKQIAVQRGITIKPANQDDQRDVDRKANELRKVLALGMPSEKRSTKGMTNERSGS